MTVLGQLAVGLVLSSIIAAIAHRRGSLTASGVAGAVTLGTIIFGCGGWVWGTLLITFFVLSTSLSRLGRSAKNELAATWEKGSRRDAGQTLANGGVGALLAVLWAWSPTPLLLAAFAGAMATVNADTWATEIGVLSRRRPRLVTTWDPVPPGTSGAVSVLGTSATLAGATVIAFALLFFLWIDGLVGGPGLDAIGASAHWLVLATTLGGLAGSLFDSLLGATVQAIYFSASRHKETERRTDPDGTANTPLRGWPWLDNDLVNLLSSVGGAAISAGVWWLVLERLA